MKNELIGQRARVKQEYFTIHGTLLEGEIVTVNDVQKSALSHNWELLVIANNGLIVSVPEEYLDFLRNDNDVVDSTSDDRVTNNVMRHNYRVLSDEEKAQMKEAKDRGLEFIEFLDRVGNSRELSLAKTKMEEAVMWSVKHITG